MLAELFCLGFQWLDVSVQNFVIIFRSFQFFLKIANITSITVAINLLATVRWSLREAYFQYWPTVALRSIQFIESRKLLINVLRFLKKALDSLIIVSSLLTCSVNHCKQFVSSIEKFMTFIILLLGLFIPKKKFNSKSDLTLCEIDFTKRKW